VSDPLRPDKSGKESESLNPEADGLPGYSFTVLSSHHGLLAAKRITPTKTFPCGKEDLWKFHPHSIASHFELAAFLKQIATMRGCCIVRGAPVEGLDLEGAHPRWSRRKNDNTIADPARAWIVYDLDDVTVPDGLGSPTRLRDAAQWIRANRLPLEFRNAKGVVTASASSGRKGPTVARLRFYFLLTSAFINDDLKTYAKGVEGKTGLPIDTSVLHPGQPIYTARPRFEEGLTDPVPEDDWAFALDGEGERVDLDLKKYMAEGKKIEAHVEKLVRKHKGDWRSLALDIVGRDREGRVGDMPGAYHEPLIKVLGKAAHSRDANEEIVSFLASLVRERGGAARAEAYNEEWLAYNLELFKANDERKGESGPRDPLEKEIERLNQRFAYLLSRPDAVMEVTWDDGRGEKTRMLAINKQFKPLIADQTFSVEGRDGQIKQLPLADLWIRSPSRLVYENADYFDRDQDAPAGWLNLFGGFATTSKAGSWDKTEWFLQNIVCNKNTKSYPYLRDLIFWKIQHPTGNPEIAIALLGNEGYGKGTFAYIFELMFGLAYYLHLQDASQANARFNILLSGKMVVYYDETFFGHDARIKQKLKGLVTEHTLTIEGKFVNPYQIRNTALRIYAGNDVALLPIDTTDRRDLVLELSEGSGSSLFRRPARGNERWGNRRANA
jgi:hypothetical protein